MRPALQGDVTAAALALLAAPSPARGALLARMLHEADAADAHRLATGRPHPDWGTGSLMSAAMKRPRAPEPFLDEPDYASCQALVFTALAARGV